MSKIEPARRRTALAVAVLACSLGMIGCPRAQNNSGPTHLRLTRQVIQPSVTRLGINLGEQTFYDSGQMNRNLIFRNPGFEGLAYRSIFQCTQAGTGFCADQRGGIQFPEGFWKGAAVEVMDGSALGQRGVVTTAGSNGTSYSFAMAGGLQLHPGDWISVYKGFYGEPTAGWWPKTGGNAGFSAERADLPPGTGGRQALRMTALERGSFAQITSYFDSFDGMSFVRLNGRYRLSFRAKSVGGGRMLHVHVGRLVPGRARYLDRDLPITPTWADYKQEFDVHEGQLAPAPVEVALAVSGAAALLDDVSLEKIDGDPTNRTVFRDEVLETLRQLHPGVLRMMGAEEELGSTIDNLLAPASARVRTGFRAWYEPSEDISIGIGDFLALCQSVDAEPWITLPAATTTAEARKLAEYLAGPATASGGALRAAQGHAEPWTRTFRTLHLELGNETWNTIYRGETMEDPAAYGRRANTVFTAFRAAAGPSAGSFNLIAGSFVGVPDRNRALLAAAPAANSLAIAPYLMMEVNRWTTDDDLFAPLLAEPEQMEREGDVRASAESASGRQLAVYEVNLHSTRGTAPQSALDRLTPSAAAGIAVVSHMLRMMRDLGVRDQALFALPQYQFKRDDGTPIRLWGSVVTMGAEGRKRPQFLAESLANRVVAGDMVKVELTGANPTRDQAPANDHVQLRGQHLIDAYGFRNGDRAGLIIFNYDLHQSHSIVLDGVRGPLTVAKLDSPSPSASNENMTQVTVSQTTTKQNELQISPCAMVVVEWRE